MSEAAATEIDERRLAPATAAESRAGAWALAVLLGLVTFAVFWPAHDYAYVSIDDWVYVSQNEHIRQGLNPDSLRYAFTEPVCANWHPLTVLSLMLDCTIYDPRDAGGLHLTNIALHSLTSAALLLVLFAMTGRLWPAAVVAALFALHPLRVESVAWISERKDVLSGLFWVLTMGAYGWYARRPSIARYLLVVVALLLGLLSKPMVVTLPIVLLLLDVWPLNRAAWSDLRSPPGRGRWMRLVGEKLPLLALVAAASVKTYIVQRDSGAVLGLDEMTIVFRLAIVINAYAQYLRSFVWPVNLAVYYPLRYGVDVPATLGALTLLIAATVIAIRARITWPWVLVGWLWYLGTLVPVIGLVQVGLQARADRYTYIPMIGFTIALAYTADAWLRARERYRTAGTVAALALLSGCIALTSRQLPTWKNSITLFTHAKDATRKNGMAYLALADELIKVGETRSALDYYELAVKHMPRMPAAHLNYATALLEGRERLDVAVREFQTVRLLGFDDALLDGYLAAAFLALDRDEFAQREIDRALARKGPPPPRVIEVQGLLLARAGKVAEAIALYESFLKDRFDSKVAARLAWWRATLPDPRLRDGNQALELANKACAVTNDGDPWMIDVKAAAFAELGQFELAANLATRSARWCFDLVKKQASPRWGILASEVAPRIERYAQQKPFRQSAERTEY